MAVEGRAAVKISTIESYSTQDPTHCMFCVSSPSRCCLIIASGTDLRLTWSWTDLGGEGAGSASTKG
jgi:hypothetical protein